MAVPLEQKTCSMAAHSALAQVMTTALAFGSFPAGVFSRLGACCPTWPQFIAGKAGAL
jgi:hypothetical protein